MLEQILFFLWKKFVIYKTLSSNNRWISLDANQLKYKRRRLKWIKILLDFKPI
jgi:hypothetical protein